MLQAWDFFKAGFLQHGSEAFQSKLGAEEFFPSPDKTDSLVTQFDQMRRCIPEGLFSVNVEPVMLCHAGSSSVSDKGESFIEQIIDPWIFFMRPENDETIDLSTLNQSAIGLYLGFFGICGVDQKVVTVKMKCRGNGIDEFTDKSIDRLGWHRGKDQPDGFRQPHRQSASLGGRDITALCGRFHHPLSGLLGNVLVTVEGP